MRERGTRYPRIKRNWQIVGSNLHRSPPNLSCFYMPRHDRFLFIIEGTSQENYWISVPRLQWNSRPRVSIPLPFLSNGRIREKFRLSSITTRKYCGGPRVSRSALSSFTAFFFFLFFSFLFFSFLFFYFLLHGEETFQRYDLSDFNKIWFLFLASFIVNCEWNFFVSEGWEIWTNLKKNFEWWCLKILTWE